MGPQSPTNALLPQNDTQNIKLRVLSLGAGVQSSTLALMAAHGEIDPMPDCAIFADTGWESKAVYEHLNWLTSSNVLPFPVHVVAAGNIRDDLVAGANGDRSASIPAFTKNVTPAGTRVPVLDEDRAGNMVEIGTRVLASDKVEIGMIRRQCTTEYKINPIRRAVREMVGIAGKRSPDSPIVEQWIGISMDEVIRMKPSMEDWQLNRFPLIERHMSRHDCLSWLQRHGYPRPPKSSCIGCPYHSDAEWRRLLKNDPEGWADAVDLDRIIRNGLRGIYGEMYLHRSGVPLDQVDLSTDADLGQLDLWPNECEGMCGL